jgi:hypothetical protein
MIYTISPLTTKLKNSTSQSMTALLLYCDWIKRGVDDFREELHRIAQNFDISRPIQTKQISDVPSLLHRSTVVRCSLNSQLSRGEGVQWNRSSDLGVMYTNSLDMSRMKLSLSGLKFLIPHLLWDKKWLMNMSL